MPKRKKEKKELIYVLFVEKYGKCDILVDVPLGVYTTEELAREAFKKWKDSYKDVCEGEWETDGCIEVFSLNQKIGFDDLDESIKTINL
jgi:hypothetical protein